MSPRSTSTHQYFLEVIVPKDLIFEGRSRNRKFTQQIHRKGNLASILKSVIMIDPVMGWFKIMQYYDKKVTTITNLVETIRPDSRPKPIDVIYNQGE